MSGRKHPLAGAAGSRDARKSAVAVLQVLGGALTPGQASEDLALSVNRYYQLEAKALAAMVAALEPAPRGRRPDAGREVEGIRRELTRAKHEAARYQALLRLSQRAMGLGVSAGKRGDLDSARKGRKARRPRARAAAAIAALSAPGEEARPESPGGGTP